MGTIQAIFSIYLIIGFLYATYILFFGGDRWYLYPINFIFGPIVLIYNLISTLKKDDRVI
jgi:fumarate reductase subunit C